MSLNLLWARSSYFFLFFLFKYDEIIIKKPSSCSFDIKVVIFRKFWKIFKNKKSQLFSPLTNLVKSLYRALNNILISEISNSTKDGNFELLCTKLSTWVEVPQNEDRREQVLCQEEGRHLKIQPHRENSLDSTIVPRRARIMLNSSTSIQNTRARAPQMKWLNTYDRSKKTPKQKIRAPLDGLNTPGGLSSHRWPLLQRTQPESTVSKRPWDSETL